MSGVRAGTLRHLEALLALTALAAIASGPAQAGDAKTKPPTPPPTTTDLGYSVVDELPAPATCDDLASAIRARATVLGGQMLVHVEPGDRYEPERGGSTLLIDTAGVEVLHARIVSLSAIPDTPGWVVQLTPELTTQAVAIVLGGSCDGKRGGARVEVRWEGVLTPASVVAVTILATEAPPSPARPTP